MPGSAPLPRCLIPLPGESLAGLLLRLAYRLETSPGELAVRTGLSQKAATLTPRHLLMLDAEVLASFSSATRLPVPAIADLTLRAQADRYPPVADSLTRPGADGVLRARGFFPPWILADRTRYCPACLRGDGSDIQERYGGPWKLQWRLATVFACVEHAVLLRDDCPTCRLPVHSGREGGRPHLLAWPAGAGLHPLQCRNTPRGRTVGDPCAAPLASPTDGPEHVVCVSVLELQHRILGLHGPGVAPLDARTAFHDLHTLATLVRATWPAAAAITPERSLATALDRHLGERARAAMTPVERSYLWAAPPAPAAATAALLDISTRLLGLPPEARREALRLLLQAAPHPSTPGWGKTWSTHRRSTSPALQAQIDEVLPPHFPNRFQPALRKRARGALIPHGTHRYRAENIPQWLPQDWFTALQATALQDRALNEGRAFRRFAAVQLVQTASGMTMEEAAAYLGIPSAWHRPEGTPLKLHPPSRYRRRGVDTAKDLARLARHASRHAQGIDYRARRLRFADWTLDTTQWKALEKTVDRRAKTFLAQGFSRIVFGEDLREVSSAYVWGLLTGSESCLAPSLDARGLASGQHLTGQRAELRRRLTYPHCSFRGYILLRDVLTDHARQLTA
ncbi:TniQ family protein [Streptomyces sp. NPDC059982]|uniref:TniQ family protein n=1 Tax=unclassified Streptomyces TaxID=2593676 RepID=UPI0036B4FF54